PRHAPATWIPKTSSTAPTAHVHRVARPSPGEAPRHRSSEEPARTARNAPERAAIGLDGGKRPEAILSVNGARGGDASVRDEPPPGRCRSGGGRCHALCHATGICSDSFPTGAYTCRHSLTH